MACSTSSSTTFRPHMISHLRILRRNHQPLLRLQFAMDGDDRGYRSARDLDVSIDTDPGLIPADMAARLATSLEMLLLQGLEDPACPLASLPIMPQAMREQVLGLAAGKTVALPEGTTLAGLCAAQAEKTPDAIALMYGEQQLSFATIHEQAARLARRLASHGVRPGVMVGIALPRTPAMVIAVLAVHKAGGAYLALDPSYPAERIRFIVADAAAPVILTNATLAPLFADSGARLLLETEPDDVEAEMCRSCRRAALAISLTCSIPPVRRPSKGGRHRASQSDQPDHLGPLDRLGRGVARPAVFDFAQFRSFGLRDVPAARPWRLHRIGGESADAPVGPAA